MPSTTAGETPPIHYRPHQDPISSHQQICRIVRELNRGPVLDVGAAQGMLGMALSGSGIDIDAVEPNPTWAELARPYYRAVHACAIENAPLGTREYRAIVCGDVLEHTPDPVSVLRKLIEVATPDATFVISLPNVAHLAVRSMLLFGKFPKMQRGILDRTHLQFFTKDTAIAMLKEAGLSVQRTTATGVPLDEVWKGGDGRLMYRFATRCQHLAVAALPRLFAMQWIFV
ncbi:MAG: class I SAM-dependent methyltransferase, partial [Tepidisphaeraceae bacterium]